MLFGLGKLFYVILLLINAVAVLSEERFLSRSMFFHKQSFTTSNISIGKWSYSY